VNRQHVPALDESVPAIRDIELLGIDGQAVIPVAQRSRIPRQRRILRRVGGGDLAAVQVRHEAILVSQSQDELVHRRDVRHVKGDAHVHGLIHVSHGGDVELNQAGIVIPDARSADGPRGVVERCLHPTQAQRPIDGDQRPGFSPRRDQHGLGLRGGAVAAEAVRDVRQLGRIVDIAVGDGHAVRLHEHDGFAAGLQGEIRVQLGAVHPPVLSRGEHDEIPAGRNCHGRKFPLFKIVWIVSQVPAVEIDGLAGRIEKLDPVAGVPVLVEKTLAVGSQKLADDRAVDGVPTRRTARRYPAATEQKGHAAPKNRGNVLHRPTTPEHHSCNRGCILLHNLILTKLPHKFFIVTDRPD